MATATPSPTPNPNALRFALDVTLPAPVSASSAADASSSPLLAALFEIDGVASVFGTADFITITRSPGGDWDEIVPAVQGAVAEHL
ncbi:MAG TPA: NifU N-terminal domain-containing protein [Acidimicrobiales bacterium]